MWFTIGGDLTNLRDNHIDVYCHLPWMYRWSDPGLFPDDLVSDYFERYLLPAGMKAGYYVLVAGLQIDLILATRVMMVFWYLATFGLFVAVLRLGRPGRPVEVVLAGMMLFLIPYHLTAIVWQGIFAPVSGGVARAACMPVLLLTVYGLARPSALALNLALVVGVACYPPAFVIACATMAVAWIAAGSPRHGLRSAVAVLPGIAVAAVVVAAWYPLGVDPRFGPMVSRDDIAWAPEIVQHHFPNGATFPYAVIYGWLKVCWPAVIAVAVQATVYRGGRLLRANLALLVAGAMTTAAAYLLWPRLYEIGRFEAWPRNVVTSVAGASVIAAAVEAVIARRPRWTASRIAWMAVVFYVSANGALTLYRVKRGRPELPHAFLDAAVAHLSDTPKDTRVAALPDEGAYPLPMLAKRSLLITPAAMFAYHRDFHREMVARLEAILNAVYATDWPAVHRLRDQYHVRYLIVDRSLFDPEHFAERAGGKHARSILPQRVQPIRDLGPNRPYLFRYAPTDAVAVEVGNYQMIDLERIP
jgi:hypothetical protein